MNIIQVYDKLHKITLANFNNLKYVFSVSDTDTSLKNFSPLRRPISSGAGSSLDYFDRSLTSSPLSEKGPISRKYY